MNLVVLIIVWVPIAAGIAVLMARARPQRAALPVPVRTEEPRETGPDAW